MKIMGLDLGFRQVKSTTEDQDYRFDSVVGYPSVMELSEDNEEGLASDNITLVYDDTVYYIGERAIKKTKNAQLTLTADKTNDKSDILKTLSAVGLAMGDKDKESFRLISGLPVDELEMDTLKADMAENLKGVYTFILNGREKTVDIEEVKIIAQSAGAYYDYIINKEGQIVEDRIHPKVIIIDTGFRTTDVVTMENAKFNPTESFTIYTGVNNIHMELRKKILKKYRIQKQPSEMDKVLRDGSIVVNGVVESLEDIIAEATRPFAEKIISELSLYIPNLREVSVFILAGGGTNLMKDYFSLPSPIEIIDDAEQANARGYYKYMKLLMSK